MEAPYKQYRQEGQQRQGFLTEKPSQLHPSGQRTSLYFKTYVRPILEYASTVWEPHTKELITQLEMVQRRAARFVTADYRRRHSVILLLNQLQWQTLIQRRTHSKVTMLYRIHHQVVAIPAGPPYIIYSNSTTSGHHLQFQQHHFRINSYQHSFFPSVVNLWNQLPPDTVGGCIAQSVPEQTRLPQAALNHILDHVYQHLTMHCSYQFLLMSYIFT